MARIPPEVEVIVGRAQELAEAKSEAATTAHLLLALLADKDQSTAGRFLRDTLKLREAEVRTAMREIGQERSGFIEQVIKRAQNMAQKARPGVRSAARSRINGLYLIRALAFEPESAANRCLVKIGYTPSQVGMAVLGGLTGGGEKALANASLDRKPRPRRTTGGYRGRALSEERREPPPPPPSDEGGGGRRPVGPRSVLRSRRPAKPDGGEPSSSPTPKISAADLRAERERSEAFQRRGRSDKQRPSAPPPPPPRKDWRESLREAAGQESSRAASLASTSDEEPALLERLARDLTEAARACELDPLVGRQLELERVVDALNRRRGNVPCLVGEPGVGKTAIVEGLAERLHAGELQGLEGKTVLQVNVGDLIAGTGVRGALSERIGQLRDEIALLEGRVVLFLDEVHSLLAATGGGAGEGAQELRSAMASGDFPCILATTSDAYRRNIEPDAGFERRLTRIDVEEPTLDEALQIIEAGTERYAEHHRVQFAPEAIEASVRLTHRYMTERRLPDKAFAVLDLAGARAQRRGLEVVALDELTEVVSELSGVPADRLAATDSERLLRLEAHLAVRIVGHEENIGRMADALRRNAAGLGGARPVGSFLMLGSTGVGKTETARALADTLFPGGGGMSRFDMSELSEAHSVARLVGAPPGYVGHEAGGQLTEAVRSRPYQVVLLDEIEKAHPKVHMLLLQVLEDGRLTDGRGRLVDFTHTVVIMTSNLGVGEASRGSIGFASDVEASRASATVEAARAALPPELWNRFDEVLYFAGLDRDQVRAVARLLLRQTSDRLEAERGVTVEFSDAVVELLLEGGGYDPSLGARPMRRAVQRLIEAPLAEQVLEGRAAPGCLLQLDVRQGRVTASVRRGSGGKSPRGVAESATKP